MSRGGGMADAWDLKSLSPKESMGSTPVLGTCFYDELDDFTETDYQFLLNYRVKNPRQLGVITNIYVPNESSWIKNLYTKPLKVSFKFSGFKPSENESGIFIREVRKNMDTQKSPDSSEGYRKNQGMEVAIQPSYQLEVIYTPATVEIVEGIVAVYNRNGTIAIKQGKNIVTIKLDVIRRIDFLSGTFTDYNAMKEARDKKDKEAQLERLKTEVKQLEK